MRKAREGLRALGAFALALTGACSSTPSSGASFAFQRPELVELACLDLSQGNENATPLPLHCCAPTDVEEPLAPEELLRTCKGGVVPVLHALVSQSVRGELAAVDLESRRVLDSDQRIPGFTFIDVGGLPTAVVVPERRPLPGQPAPDPKQADGPPWTYIASADEQALRAVATCRFRTGVPCGPELSIGNADLARVALGGAPRDMLLGPDQALWVSLPDLGVLARVQVGTAAEALADAGVAEDAGAAEDDAGSGEDDKPFLLAADGASVDAPQYYRVPVGAVPAALALADDTPAYVAACGLGYAYESRASELPRAPEAVVEGTPSAQPARMRYDALSGLLLVSDRALPVLHVFSLDADGNLVSRGALPMGAPVRDFAFTAFVPETVDIFSKEPISSEATDQKRYLYALDDRDGSLMQFAFEASADGASVTPLRAPMRDRFEDRAQMFGVGSVLEVVDTRALSPYTCGEGVEPKTSNESIARQLQRELEAVKKRVSKAEKDRAKALAEGKDGEAKVQKLDDQLKLWRPEQRRLQSQYDIAVNAGPTRLRGVFLMVVSLAGDVSVFDILDLDVACRARTSCVDEPPENPLRAGNNRLDGTTPTSLAVQRNALRLTVAGKPTIVVSATTAFESIDCAAEVPDDGSAWEPYVEGLKGTAAGNQRDEAIICVPPDPWNQVDTQWAVEEDRELPGLAFANGYVTRVEAKDLESDVGDADAGAGEGGDDAEDLAPLNQMLWVHVPHGTNLCARGAQEGVGDQVVIVGAPLNTPSACPNPVVDDRPILKVVRAYSDRLLVRALGRTEGSQPDDEKLSRSARNANYAARARDEVSKLLECYPEFVSFQVRVGEERVDGDGVVVGINEEATEIRKVFAVLGSNTGFLSRMTTDDNGRCVLDPTKDARLRARATRGRPFQNTSIAFTIARNEPGGVITIGVNGGRSILASSVVPANDYPDALPRSIRWFPLTNDLFVVDSASQGLRRFTLTPFGRDSASYR